MNRFLNPRAQGSYKCLNCNNSIVKGSRYYARQYLSPELTDEFEYHTGLHAFEALQWEVSLYLKFCSEKCALAFEKFRYNKTDDEYKALRESYLRQVYFELEKRKCHWNKHRALRYQSC